MNDWSVVEAGGTTAGAAKCDDGAEVAITFLAFGSRVVLNVTEEESR